MNRPGDQDPASRGNGTLVRAKDRRRPTVTLLEEGIVGIDYSDLTVVTLDQARYTFRVRQELTGGRAVGIFFMGDRLVHFDRDAAEFAASPTVAATILAAAAAPTSIMVRGLARLFIMYHRPPYPTRVFSEAEDAFAWLRERVR